MALAILILVAGCYRPLRQAPIDPLSGDWPTLQGNVERSGYAAEVVPEEVEVAWRADVGRGLMAPVLVEGTVVFASTSNRMVSATSAEDGSIYWDRRLGGSLSGGLVRHAGRIFVPTAESDGELHAVEPVRGRVVWSRSVGMAPFPPLVVGDAVYLATGGGNIFSFAARNGEELWRTRVSGRTTSTPIPYREKLLVPTAADTLFLLDRVTGTVEQRLHLPGRVSAAPALHGDLLYVPFRSGELVALRLPELEEVWRVDIGEPILASPIVAPDGSIFLLNRSVEVWRIPTGTREAQRIAQLGGASIGSFTLAADRLIVGRLDGRLFMLRTDGSIVWEEDLRDSIVAPVTVHERAIYVPLQGGHIVKLR